MTLAELEAEAEGELDPLVLNASLPAKVREPRLSTGQAVEKYGKRDSSGIIAQEKTKAHLANRELIRRLMKDPAQFKNGELNFIAGTAVDKVAKKERWDRSGDDGGKSWSEQFVNAVARLQGEGGVKLSLEITAPGAKKIDAQIMPAIDVEAVPE
jgi:hypothetical protein